MQTAPVDTVPANKTFFDILPNGITGYRFINPSGIHFDGICAHTVVTEHVLFAPQPPLSDSTWFHGHSWRVLYATGCEGYEAHLGWAFYKNGMLFTETKPSFLFLILSSSFENLRERMDIHVQLGLSQQSQKGYRFTSTKNRTQQSS